MKKERGRKCDGKSRVSNDLYRKRWKDIFDKVTDDNAESVVHSKLSEEEEYLEELKKKL